MRYRVVLHPDQEGFAVSCPGLPGCWTQGATEEEALTNIATLGVILSRVDDEGPSNEATEKVLRPLRDSG